MPKRASIPLVVSIGFLVLTTAFASQGEATKLAEAKQDAPKKSLIARKLQNAHKMLDGVAMNDNTAVELSAEELIKISKDLSWQKARSERYDELSAEYQKELRGLIKAAREKSDPALALAYVRVSLACFRCHDEVRTMRIADNRGQ